MLEPLCSLSVEEPTFQIAPGISPITGMVSKALFKPSALRLILRGTRLLDPEKAFNMLTNRIQEVLLFKEQQLKFSSLCQTIFYYGRSLNILIYKAIGTEWTLEIIDGKGKSAMWKDSFATEQSALNEILKAVENDNIDSLLNLSGFCEKGFTA